MKQKTKYWLLICCQTFALIVLPLFPMAQNSNTSQQNKIGFFSVTAYITITGKTSDQLLLDSLSWQKQKMAKHFYAGKIIDQIIYQKATDRIVVFAVGGRKCIPMNKATAIKEGLIYPDPIVIERPKEKEPEPVNVTDIIIDSPLIVGIINHVCLTQFDNKGLLIPFYENCIERIGATNNYAIKVQVPGPVELFFVDSITERVKYAVHFVAKRSPADELKKEPVVTLGNIATPTASPAIIKQQQEIKATDGFSFESAFIYFSGAGFQSVLIASVYKNLGAAKCLMDYCIPGSVITVDNVQVSAPNGKIYAVNGFSIKVTDGKNAPDSAESYFMNSYYPKFPEGDYNLKYYLREQLGVSDDSTFNEGRNVSLLFMVGADSSITTCNDELSGMSDLERKCYEIIKNGPKWIPGRYKDTDVSMPVAFSEDISH
jgi:hypothetical protein